MTYVSLQFDLNHNVKHFKEIIQLILALKMLRFEHNFDEESGINVFFLFTAHQMNVKVRKCVII